MTPAAGDGTTWVAGMPVARGSGPGAGAGTAPVPPVTAPVPVSALPPRRQPVATTDTRPGLSDDPEWYRTAVFYEVIVRAFSDSDGSGTGDLRGLVDRLDYLQWLGVDALWLPRSRSRRRSSR